MNRDAKQVLTELLTLRAQGGDERAFTQLYELWSVALRGFVRSWVDDPHSAEEVAQDAWVSIARDLSRLDDPACFPRWAMRIAARRSADWVRRRQTDRRRRAQATEQAFERDSVVGVEDSAPLAALGEAVASLDADARALLHLFYSVGFSVGEIAVALGLKPGTVKSRLFAIRETIKNKMEGNKDE